MRLLIFITMLAIAGCSNPNKITISRGKEKVIFNSGNFSGLDYIMITKLIRGRKNLEITIDCNHYITGIGKTIFVRKETYDSKGVFLYTSHLIKDSMMFLLMNYHPRPDPLVFNSLTSEEYGLIKRAYMEYPALINKYDLNVNSFENYLGWIKIQL